MANISRITPGQVLFDVQRRPMGNTTVRCGFLYRVRVVEVDPQWVLASWNGNPPQKYYRRQVARWKVKEPKPKGTRFGMPSY